MEEVKVPSVLYDSLFTIYVSEPELEVDSVVWNRIMTGLPSGYTMPDFAIIEAFMKYM
ncbi:hypothetical protein [Paenibacillus swuensis]|uniref:hypothetical protein n=1 Tax=Paenibacillus swuensis TaxID=1178515 RepID=UPI000A635532|nr:hypothetical protein [Paenibacillus swuensis]